MLEVREIHKSFGSVQAVRGVSFTVEKGQILGFLGPNGAGKTTTMRMITGFLPPTSGTALVCGHDVTKHPLQVKKSIGYLPENAPVYSDMTVTDFLVFVAGIRGFDGRQLTSTVESTIEKCRLSSVKSRTIDTLSRGYKQRVCFAQAVLHDPPVLIMDEPTDGLDPNQKHLVRTMIREMARDKVVIISTHILEEVDALCSKVIIINNGSIVAHGTPAEMKARGTTHGAVEIAFTAVPNNAEQMLKSLSSAARVETRDKVFTIFPKESDQLFAEISKLVRDKSWDLAGLRVLEGRLDEVFRDLTLGSLKESETGEKAMEQE